MTTLAKPQGSPCVDTAHVECIGDPVERYHTYEWVRKEVLKRLTLIGEASDRAALYRQLADVLSAQAVIYHHVEHDLDLYRAGLAELNTSVRLLGHVAHAEASRARGYRTPLVAAGGRFAWPDLEVAVGWLLNELTRSPRPQLLGRLYEAIASELVGRGVIASDHTDVLLALAETHVRRAAA